MFFRLLCQRVIRLKGSADRSDILGMTILELMIVLTIIGIISAISIPIFLDIKDRSIIATTEGNLNNIRKSLNHYMVDDPSNHYPSGTLDYTTLRSFIPFAKLPPIEADAKIQTGSLFYSSDGVTYNMTVRSNNSDNNLFTVTPAGIIRN